MNTFPRKQYGRIFVENADDIPKVESIIKEMDEFEYGYLPTNLIGVFQTKEHIFNGESEHHSIDLVYTHKFDSLDLNALQVICWMRGIHVFVVMSNQDLVFID